MSLTTIGSMSSRDDRHTQLLDSRLYLCTDSRREQDDLREFLHAAYEGGVDIIQLRDKSLDTAAEILALEVLRDVSREHGKLFAVNDRADVAAIVGADVFHVGQTDLTPKQARRIVGPDVLIGRSNHSVKQFRESMEDPLLDYAVIGPVWETPTKPGRSAVGLETVAEAAAVAAEPEHTDKAWFAIGGVNVDTAPEVLATGTSRLIVVRAITQAPDPARAAAELQTLLR